MTPTKLLPESACSRAVSIWSLLGCSSRVGRIDGGQGVGHGWRVESGREQKILKTDSAAPDLGEGVHIADLKLEHSALRQEHLRIRGGHFAILIEVEMIGAVGARDQCIAVARGFEPAREVKLGCDRDTLAEA